MRKTKHEEVKLMGCRGDEWGAVHCAECKMKLGYFPPDSSITEELDLELYCAGCKERVE